MGLPLYYIPYSISSWHPKSTALQFLIALLRTMLARIQHVSFGLLPCLGPRLTAFLDYNIYQSNGECQTHCQGSYAFAILQGLDCWCSNYIPAEQVSTYDCNQPCPGFPSEWCGSTDAGLYGYYLLGSSQPLGTSAGSGASSTSRSASSVSKYSFTLPPDAFSPTGELSPCLSGQ